MRIVYELSRQFFFLTSIFHPLQFEDFYERNNSVRASSDGPVLYCPRCTRQVTNAHGVCGHCGEVAFQCRKCRHINYDRLDAFLCVECGYCTSGAFQVSLNSCLCRPYELPHAI